MVRMGWVGRGWTTDAAIGWGNRLHGRPQSSGRAGGRMGCKCGACNPNKPGPTRPKPNSECQLPHRVAREDAHLWAHGAARLAIVAAHAARKVELVAADALG